MAKEPFYAKWTQAELLALILKGIRKGKIEDQTIIGPDSDTAALSDIIHHHILIK